MVSLLPSLARNVESRHGFRDAEVRCCFGHLLVLKAFLQTRASRGHAVPASSLTAHIMLHPRPVSLSAVGPPMSAGFQLPEHRVCGENHQQLSMATRFLIISADLKPEVLSPKAS